MSHIWTVITLLLITMDELFAVSPIGGVTSFCRVTANATKGQNASLECVFGNDVNRLQLDVHVFHNKLNTENIVLEVLWVKGIRKVNPQPGYELKGNITTSLVLEINQVTQGHEGLYTCGVSGSAQNSNSSKSCTLFVHAVDYKTVSSASVQNIKDSNNTASPEYKKQSYVFMLLVLVWGVQYVSSF